MQLGRAAGLVVASRALSLGRVYRTEQRLRDKCSSFWTVLITEFPAACIFLVQVMQFWWKPWPWRWGSKLSLLQTNQFFLSGCRATFVTRICALKSGAKRILLLFKKKNSFKPFFLYLGTYWLRLKSGGIAKEILTVDLKRSVLEELCVGKGWRLSDPSALEMGSMVAGKDRWGISLLAVSSRESEDCHEREAWGGGCYFRCCIRRLEDASRLKAWV